VTKQKEVSDDSSIATLDDRGDDSESDTVSVTRSVTERLSLLEQRVEIQHNLLQQLSETHTRTEAQTISWLQPMMDLVRNANEMFMDLKSDMKIVVERLSVLETDIGEQQANLAACNRVTEQREPDVWSEGNSSESDLTDSDVPGADFERDMWACTDEIESLKDSAEQETSDPRILWDRLRHFDLNNHCQSISVKPGPPERQLIELRDSEFRFGRYAECQCAQELQETWYNAMMVVKYAAAAKGIKLTLKLEPDMENEFRALVLAASEEEDSDYPCSSRTSVDAGVQQSKASSAVKTSRSAKKKQTRGRGQQLHRYRAGRR
jgi:hypothetical protein